MGLDTSHDCWHGSYGRFGAFRVAVCQAAGLGDLSEYRGFRIGNKEWPPMQDEPLVVLLNHSDCDGEISWQDCEPLARRLDEIADDPRMAEWRDEAIQFARGCREAARLHEHVEFG
jgi:hypothetical protein